MNNGILFQIPAKIFKFLKKKKFLSRTNWLDKVLNYFSIDVN